MDIKEENANLAIKYLEERKKNHGINSIFTDYCNMAIEALEKQIPKEPYYSGDGYWNGELVYDTWTCPNCSKSYEVDYDDYDYCPNCGQRIKREK